MYKEKIDIKKLGLIAGLFVSFGLFFASNKVIAGDTIPINFGETVLGSIDPTAETDTYTFSANAGDTVLVRISEASVFLSPEIRLYSPDGTELKKVWDPTTAEISFTLTDDGEYTILACDHYGTNTGNYTLSLSIQIVEQLTPGDPYVGNISTGNWHLFYVDVEADKNLLVTLEPTSSTAILELYGRYDQPPTQSDCGYFTKKKNIFGNYELLISPTQSGTYYFAVYGKHVDGTTGYQITASIVNQHISDTYPKTVASSTGATVHIVGLGFTNGMQVELRSSGGSNILAKMVVVSSSTMVIAHFDLSGAPLGLYNIFLIWPDGYEKMIEGAIEVKELQEGALYAFDVNIEKGSTVTYDIVIQEGTQNLFVTLQKTTLVSYGNSWQGTLSLLRSGGQITSTNGSHDLILHIVDPAPGAYTIKITADQAGSGILTVWASLPELPLRDWVVGKIYCSYGSIWYQVDVPPEQDKLYFEAEAMGLWSHFDIYYGQYGSSDHWVSHQGTQTSIEIPEPNAGTYIVEFLDSAMLYSDSQWREDQTRDVLIRAHTAFTKESPPDYIPTIASISTDKGGNTGLVTVEIKGAWLDPNSTVSLVRSGFEDIIAQNVSGDPNCTTLTTTFDLTDKEPGQYNLTVTNPDGQSTAAPSPFTIEEGREPELWVEIIGRERIRVERPARYIVRYGNSGNVDADFAIIQISLSQDVQCIKVTQGQTTIWDQATNANEPLTFVFPLISAGEESSLEVTVNSSGSVVVVFIRPAVTKFLTDSLFNLLEHKSDIYIAPDQPFWSRVKTIILESFKYTLQDYKKHPVKHTISYLLGILCADAGKTLESAGLIEDARQITNIWDNLSASQSFFDALPENIKDLLGLEEVGDSLEIEAVSSATPEDKYGPSGFDPLDTPLAERERFVPEDRSLYYKVDFWNKEDATAPACDVLVKDQLASNLDWNNFRFEKIGFLKWDVELEPCQYFNLNVDTRPDMDLIVNVEGTFDPETGEITWTFRSLDPATMETPEDPMAGFLPPITESGEEVGWVTFSAKPKDGLPTGTQVSNQAFVEFDWAGDLLNHPAPKEGPWINTLDAGIPSSNVLPLPQITETRSFLVEWSGQDDLNGSGIHGYDIYVSTDSNDYVLWIADTNDTSGTFIGEGGRTYSFYSRARDNVGHIEPAPDSPDSITTSVWITGDFCGVDFGSEDGYVDVWDLMQLADHWHTRPSDSNWDAKFDLAGPDFGDIDDYVDIWDLMVFADNWHKGQKP